jgi:tetratricopeptide (TPR) repeat protein
VISFLLALAAAPQVAGPVDSADNRYKACIAQVRTAPQQAVEKAEAWLRAGGGIRAGQCLGLAYSAVERWPDAALAFEAAAREANAKQDRRRGDLWVQSGNSWLAAGEAAKARIAFDSALATNLLTDELKGEVYVDRSRAAAALGDKDSARTDLDKGLELVPGDPFAWYLSAALARQEGNLPKAQEHIAKAVSLAPDDAAILLEAGNIAGASGEIEAAKGLYARAVRRAPESEAGRAARAALAANGEAAPQ